MEMQAAKVSSAEPGIEGIVPPGTTGDQVPDNADANPLRQARIAGQSPLTGWSTSRISMPEQPIRAPESVVRTEMTSSPDDGSEYEIIRDRIEARMQALDLNANALSRHAGLERSTVRKFLARKNKAIEESSLRRIAQVLNCTPAYLRGDVDEVFPPENRGGNRLTALNTVDVPIVGTIEAGAFRPVTWFNGKELGVVKNGYNPDWVGVEQFGYRVAGDTMDLAGIPDGSEVVCINPDEAGVGLEEGSVVVVETLQDRGRMRELTLKLLTHIDGRWMLVARSSNPSYEPIPLDRVDGASMRVLGIVISVIHHLPVKRSPKGVLAHMAGQGHNTSKFGIAM